MTETNTLDLIVTRNRGVARQDKWTIVYGDTASSVLSAMLKICTAIEKGTRLEHKSFMRAISDLTEWMNRDRAKRASGATTSTGLTEALVLSEVATAMITLYQQSNH